MASNFVRRVPQVSAAWPKFKSKSGLPESEGRDVEKRLYKAAQKPLNMEEHPPVLVSVRYRVCQHRKPNFVEVDKTLPTAQDLNMQSLQPAQHPKYYCGGEYSHW